MKPELQHRANQLWMNQITALLDGANIPEFVHVDGITGNSAPHRLKWFLSRRKDVSEKEHRAGKVELEMWRKD